MNKRIDDFTKKSPRQSRVDDLKSKLPFLNLNKKSTDHGAPIGISERDREVLDPENFSSSNADSAFLKKGSGLGSTVTSFKGIHLKKMEKELIRNERES